MALIKILINILFKHDKMDIGSISVLEKEHHDIRLLNEQIKYTAFT